MSQLIVLVRHGQSQANVEGILSDELEKSPLTPLGREQAGRTAKELKKLRLDALVSSPVLRARQTAGIIGEETGLEVRIDDRLRETGMGSNNGAAANGGMWKFKKGVRFESAGSVYRRTMEFIREQDYGSFVAVAHKVQVTSILFSQCGLDEFTGFACTPLNASMTLMLRSGGRLRFLAVGLPELPDSVMARVPKRFRAEV
ncbi:MAG: histidine phosphatase family protein [Candidatus Marsarchaeota archaeon]|jgi:probable phosphoglycerate mutase|nr:histidine phosphatase family protein [Candidatus Marsarchaeota archaeon]